MNKIDYDVVSLLIRTLVVRPLLSKEQLLADLCAPTRPELPNPSQVHLALAKLRNAGAIKSRKGPDGLFYSLSDTPEEKIEVQQKVLFPAMEIWSACRHSPHLEQLLEESARGMKFQRGQESDSAVVLKQGRKAVRALLSNDWVTSKDRDLNEHLEICRHTGMLPAVLAQRIEPLLTRILHKAGVKTMDTFDYYVPAQFEKELRPVMDPMIGGLTYIRPTDCLDKSVDDWLNHSLFEDWGNAVKQFRQSDWNLLSSETGAVGALVEIIRSGY